MTADQNAAQNSAAPNRPRDLILRLYREIGIAAVAAALEASAHTPREPLQSRNDLAFRSAPAAYQRAGHRRSPRSRENIPWTAVIEAAFDLRDRLAALGLQSFVKASGEKRLHVVVPVQPDVERDQAKMFSKSVAETMAKERQIAMSPLLQIVP